jgi:ferredoxin
MGGFLSSPFILGSTVIMHPIKKLGGQQHAPRVGEGAQQSSSSANKDSSKDTDTCINMFESILSERMPADFPIQTRYCTVNPCVTKIVHILHRRVLDGNEDAEVDLNRMLTLCAFIQPGSDASFCDAVQGDSGDVHSGSAFIDVCCPCQSESHTIRMVKQRYRQQFRVGCSIRFLKQMKPHGGATSAQNTHQSFEPLRIPLTSLVPCAAGAYSAFSLPDIAQSLRMILQKRFFNESFKKEWTKAAASTQVLLAGGASDSASPEEIAAGIAQDPSAQHHTPFVKAVHASSKKGRPASEAHGHASTLRAASNAADSMWGQCNTLRGCLLQESIPCLKRCKRPPSMSQTFQQRHPALVDAKGKCTFDAVDVSSCITILHATLLKLYRNLGVKTPVFKAKAFMAKRLMHLSTMPSELQTQFLLDHPALVRICFMEYSLNMLLEWLPCERELFCRTCPTMSHYFNVAISMCDTFRQEAVTHGTEDWQFINRVACINIERCIRVCKFKHVRIPDPIVRKGHVNQQLFDARALSHMPRLNCAREWQTTEWHVPGHSSSQTVATGHTHDGRDSLPHSRAEGTWTRPSKDRARMLVDSFVKLDQGGASGNEEENLLDSCRQLAEHFSVHALPRTVRAHQLDALASVHGSCTASLVACRKMSFCIVCAINGKGFQSKLRMCSVSGTLSCISCKPGA